MQAETVIAVAATVVALGSLWVSYSQSRAARVHNRQSLRPILQIRRIRNRQQGLTGLKVINAGLGPAVITATVVRWDGVVAGQWAREAWNVMLDSDEGVQKYALRQGSVVLVGESTFLVRLDTDDPDRLLRFHDGIRDRLAIDIHYESVYGGEGFVVSSNGAE
ncbi:hypothetical protein G9272_17750 [Streptomyces asoensis]|uniref:Uncharacterized protein n=1 Tax=Streptomyces asoensis TaxID=249586 RepID=A0A6M4WMX7_9ACTN|nr:hypothetical protein [Streptomyces asoensis]QJT01930.1 hypothetical protein G9272_17750 [Streptomyces asoensis]